ncbi:MAG: HAMP domain-containing sensor histidine kinase [Terrimicrobiaceae bacterium]
MNFRLRVAAWFAVSVFLLVAVLIFTAHQHLDEELRKDRWDRSHPQFPGWVIHGSYTDEEVHDILSELIHVWLWVGIPLVLASVAVGYFIALRSVRPIRQINRELAALNPSSFASGVHLPERDEELAVLVRHINDLLQRVGRSYNEMAEFSARVAHELRTPLTLLRMRTESAAPELPPDFSEEVQEEIRRLSQLVERSLLAAKAEGGKLDAQTVPVDLAGLLEDLHEGYALLASERSITLDWRTLPGLVVASDTELLRQILHNLIGNAIRHGREKVRVSAMRSRTAGRIVVRIANFIGNGNSGQIGTGMGLRLVRSLANVLGKTQFQIRQTTHVFSVRLLLPAATPNQPRP